MRAIGSTSSRIKRVVTAAAVALGMLTTGTLLAAPAMADDGWRGHHRHHHHQRHHRHHRHHNHGGLYFNYAPPVYYAPPPVYYAPPPVYYAPRVYAPPSVSLGLAFPLR